MSLITGREKMKNKRYLFFRIIIVLLLCMTILSGCNEGVVDPNQGGIPSGPAIDGDNNGSDDSGQNRTPDDTESSDSSIMDGEDHVEMPFG